MSCRTVSDFLDKHANDVSRGGIFVRNAQVLAVGCTVRLNLQLADGSTLLAGEGTVFWTREADPTRAESEPGMGIRFTRLTNESQRMLTHLLAEKTERERQEERTDFDDDDERTVVATQEEMEAAASSGDAPSAPIEAMPALASVPMTVSAPLAAPPIRPRVSTRVLASVPASASHAQPLAKVVPLPTPSTHVHAVPAPQAKPIEKVVEIAAPPLPVTMAPARTSARRSTVAPLAPAPAPITLPVPAATSAAWEEDDEPIAPPVPRAPDFDVEHTDLVPRGSRSVGVGVAVGAITALVLSLLLLNKPFVRRLTVASRSTPAQVIAPPPLAAPPPVIAPLEPAAAATAPLDPAHP